MTVEECKVAVRCNSYVVSHKTGIKGQIFSVAYVNRVDAGGRHIEVGYHDAAANADYITTPDDLTITDYNVSEDTFAHHLAAEEARDEVWRKNILK